MSKRGAVGFIAVAIAVGLAVFFAARPSSSPSTRLLTENVSKPTHWATETLRGRTRLRGQVPLAVGQGSARYVAPHPKQATLKLNFSFPLRTDQGSIDELIAQEAKTHRYLSRAQIYARFAPPAAQVAALEDWLTRNGFTITHLGADRMSIGAQAPTAVVERALHTTINDYVHPGYRYHGKVDVAPYTYYANTTPAQVPARLGVQTVSGLSDVDRFFTAAQLAGPQVTNTRSGGYWPADLRSMYDVHGFDGTGQTVGFTLWGAGERQAAMTSYATATGDQLITVDPFCVATGNSPTTPSSCTTQVVQGDHLLTILENGNANNLFGSNVETALDIEQAHGMATHVAMKYYDGDCSSTPPTGSGLSNGGNCNGSDVGLEEAVEDAANDPTLHSVSNSWGYGGEPEWGTADPFMIAVQNSLAIGAAAGTTFYFSTGDSGTYFSGFPADLPYVVAVGGTSLFSTSDVTKLSTETTWAAAGSWCSNIVARPSWQDVPAVQANAACPGRSIPDISAIADTNTSVRFVSSTNATGGTQAGGVGGTSVAAPELNGMTAVLANFVAAQSYGGATPSVGFTGPVLYQMGSSGHADSYFRDVVCGNTANPAGGPDGDAAQAGWDPATGWGAPDWFNMATGYAITLGATNLAVPASLSQHYKWGCARTPGNSSERSIAFPSASTGYAVGAASGGTPWYAKMLASGSWGAVNTFYKTIDGGKTWFPSNSDMMSIACTSAASCVEVGDGGRIKRTTDGGSTWTDVASPFNKGLTQVTCPDGSTCYAAGDRGTLLKSGDGGATWSYLPTVDGNPIYGLSCPTAAVCYATDIYAHVAKTTDGGATWALQRTPVTTPGVSVPGSGGPNPFAGLFGISCTTASACVAVGGFPPAGTDPPIVTTTDGGATWILRTSNSGANNYLHSVSCVAGTATCFAAGRGGSIVTSSDGGATWSKMTSNTTNALNSIACTSASSCIATGQNGTIDVLSGGTWAATTGNGGSVFLASVTCAGGACYVAGKQGVTLGLSGSGWTQQAGGGTTQQMNAIACTSDTVCTAVGNAGTILQTSNGGQVWAPRTSGTTSALNALACPSPSICVAAGAGGTIVGSTDGGATWSVRTSGTTNALTGVACSSTTSCVAVGAAGTLVGSGDGGATWSARTSGTTTNLNAVACTTDDCFATGSVAGGSAVMLGSADAGTTWTAQTSNSPQALSAIACLDDDYCFAGGAIGTVVATTDGGQTWTQQSNPISGPLSALNAGPTGITQINGAACSAARCFMATASSGNIMETPLLTVTVNSKSEWGTLPSLSGLAPSDPAISYSPAGEAANVTGTLTCATTADDTSPVGTYGIAGCSGLDDDGFNVVYDYDDSTHTVVKAHQTITFAALADKTWGDVDFTVTATASSGLPVTFAASGSCTVADGLVHIVQAGPCAITASQAGDDRYLAAPDVTQSITVARAPQTISFTGPSPQTFGNADFDIDPVSDSGLPVSVAVTDGTCTLSSPTAPSTVHLTAAGSCEITASQGGNVDYLPAADAVRSFAIAKANQTITFGPIADRTWGDADVPLTATASSGLPVSYVADGNCTLVSGGVHIVSAGTCTVTASQAGDVNYNPASDVAQTFKIKKADQTIAFAALPNRTFGDADFSVVATASSGLPVSFALGSGNNACTLTGTTVHITGTGTCSIVASQAGSGNYNAAPSVTQSFTIANSASGTITGLLLRPATGGQLDFRFDARRLSGQLVYIGPITRRGHGRRPTPPVVFTATSVTSIGISADGHSALIAGVGKGGVPYLLYVEDNGNTRFPHRTKDVAKLTIGGATQDGDGSLVAGLLTISQR